MENRVLFGVQPFATSRVIVVAFIDYLSIARAIDCSQDKL